MAIARMPASKNGCAQCMVWNIKKSVLQMFLFENKCTCHVDFEEECLGEKHWM